MNNLAYVVVRNTLALVLGLFIVWGTQRIWPTIPHDFAVLSAAVFIAGYIADNAVSNAKRISEPSNG